MEGERYYIRIRITDLDGCVSYNSLNMLPGGKSAQPTGRPQKRAPFRWAAMGDTYLFTKLLHARRPRRSPGYPPLFLHITPRRSAENVGRISPRSAEGESEESICVALIQRDADLMCEWASLSSFPATPEIDQAVIDRKKRNARPEFEPAKERLYAPTHTPMISQEKRQAIGDIFADSVDGFQSSHFATPHVGRGGGTFLYNVQIAEIRGIGLGADFVASPGISALLLSGGEHRIRNSNYRYEFPTNRIAPFRKGRRLQSSSTDWR